MRIRKHAKISPLVYAASSLKPGTVLQTHVCQLNQSPWDVMKFSPPPTPPPPPPPSPPPQMDGDGVSSRNGNSEHCISVAERDHQRWEYSDDIPMGAAAVKVEEPPPQQPMEIVLCCKTDGKSWQCRREASKGNSLCDHHLTQLKSYNNHSSSHHVAKKSAEAPRPARTKKTLASSTSNPYEFYYYSGFGPRWGKKRGEANCKNNNITNGGGMNKNVEHEDDIEQPMDYDEFEDEEEEDRYNVGKKRVRKPIKARSLKSLM